MRQKKSKPINKLARLIHAKNPDEQSFRQVRKELKDVFRREPVAEVYRMIGAHNKLEAQSPWLY